MNWKAALKKFEKPLTILAGATGLTAILMNLDFNLLESNLYDLRASRGLQRQADSQIVLVTLDDATTQALDEVSPLPLDQHVRFLEKLEELQPRAVGYLIDMNQVSELGPELFRKEWGSRFVQAAKRLESKGSAVLLGTNYDVTGEVVPPFPLSELSHSLALVHKDGNVFAEDKVTRRALVALNQRPSFHVDFARRLGALGPDSLPRGTFSVPEVDGKYFFFRYHGNTALARGTEASLPYARIPFLDILQGRVQPGALKGKIVLVGSLMKDDPSDYAFTPFAKSAFTNPKLVIHANIVDAVLHDEGVVRTPGAVNWAVTFLVTAFVLWWVLNSTPLSGVFSTLGLTVVFLGTGQLLYGLRGIWLRESQPLVGIFVGYYLVVPYRLIREYKKRWDYQRKNEILTQVEELKTNFLSLVTHDLKTPVARIQGLAEVLMAKANGRLIERDLETLSHIIASTDELNNFISSILELSKIDSNRLSLQLESKDVNQLVERSVEGFKAPARARKIKIHSNLEPLFPIKVDAALISKVINNLVDNALKYSPAGSEIHVSSREIPAEGTHAGHVEISVRDQGIGMTAEERENLFTRFYRAKNDQTIKTPGTGLGLYLTKYFIEMHHGRVEVSSEKGKGSVFRILLPLDVRAQPGLQTGKAFAFGAKVADAWQRFSVSGEDNSR
jgi:signal transduction histidine kinase